MASLGKNIHNYLGQVYQPINENDTYTERENESERRGAQQRGVPVETNKETLRERQTPAEVGKTNALMTCPLVVIFV